MVSELQDNMKHINIHIIGIPEGEKQGTENLLEKVIMENFHNLIEKKSHKSRKHRESQARGTQRGSLQDTSQLKWQNSKTKRGFKGSKGETGSNIQGSPDKVSS